MSPDKSLQNLFNEALERQDATERARFLDDACGADAALRERVEKLLRAHDDAGGFLSQPSKSAAQASGTIALPVTEKPGDLIGRYKLLQQIGEGGCGVVYMAEQEEPVRRRVALKVIKLGMDTKQVIARFEAERQALALMDHPHIARVLDAAATETGRPYFVMELVRGTKITEFCDQKELPTQERLDLFLQVCSAIQHAHQKGIIHRDIKPSNILVTVVDGVPVPKVIDFGIAKATNNQPLTDKTVFTAFEQFIGTPAYMSPEQAELSGVDIDTRTDIYSLGVVLYELLTGSPPFDQKELLAAGLDEMRRIIRETEPPRPSNRLSTMAAAVLTTTAHHRHTEPPKLVHLVRGDLDWIAMKCLEKDRARRYETANALAADVRRHLDCEPVVARPPSRWYEFQQTVRRHKFGFAAAGAVILALSIGLGVSMWQVVQKNRAYTRTAAAEREQSRQRQIAEAKEKQSEQVAQFLKDMLASVEPSVAMGRDATMLREVLDRTAERVGKDLKEQPEVEAELRHTIAEVYLAIAEYAKAEQNHREALALRQKQFGRESLELAASLDGLARALLAPVLRINFEAMTERNKKQLKEAETLAQQAVAIRKSLLGTDHLDVAHSLDTLGGVVDQQRRFDQAEAIFREGLAIKEKLLGKEHLSIADSLSEMVGVFSHENKLVEAESVARQSLTMRKKLLGDEHPLTVKSAAALARVLQAMSGDPRYKVPAGVDMSQSAINARLTEAQTLNRQVLAIQKRVLPEDHPEVTATLAKLANVLEYQRKLNEAEGFYREVLVRRQKQFGTNHPQTTLARRAVDRIRQFRASSEDEIALRESLADKREAHGNEHEEVALSMYMLARLLQTNGKLAEAERLCRESLVMQRKLLGPSDPAERESLESLAGMLKRQGKQDEVEALYREELALRRQALGDEHPHTLSTLNLLGGALQSQRKHAEACELFREELTLRRKRYGEESVEALQCLSHLASAQAKAGEPAGAEMTYQDLLRLSRKLTQQEQFTAQMLGEWGLFLQSQRRFEDAVPAHREELELRKKMPGDNDRFLNAAVGNLARALQSAGKHAEATSLYREDVAMQKRIHGETHRAVGTALGNLARSLEAEGKLTDAEAAWREASAVEKRLSGDDHPFVAKSLYQLARFLTEAGRLGEAELVNREVLAIRRKSLGYEHRLTWYSLVALGLTLQGQGKHGEAAAFFREELGLARAADGKGWASTNAELGLVLHHFAESLWNLKAFKEARPPAEEAWTLFEQHPDWLEGERFHAYQVLQAVLTGLNDQPALESLQRAMRAHRMRWSLALKTADSSDANALNEAAWFLATCEDAAFRDGPRAVQLAEKAVRLKDRKDPMILDTLAAAYAETGEFAKAASVQKEAIALLSHENQKKDFASRLKLYEANTPYREGRPTANSQDP